MTDTFSNVYDDTERARAYADLEFPGTYSLAFRDLPALLRKHVRGTRAVDFGCGTGRSTRFLRDLGFDVIGVDISERMLAEARGRDPQGDYRLVADGSLAGLGTGSADLILAAFTFDNTTDRQRASALRELRRLLAADGRLVVVVSSADIYLHEWASFSTRDYPANRSARDGDLVRIVMLDVPDRRPVVDVLCGDAHYRELFEAAGLRVVDTARPLATGAEPVQWVSETRISPWSIYALGNTTDAMRNRSGAARRLLCFPAGVARDPGVEAWFDSRRPPLGAIARAWFLRMRGCGSDVRELLHDGHPTACVGDAAFAYTNVFTAHVNVGFFRGATLPDPAGLLEGDGKYMRHVKLRPDTAVDAAALEALITAAYLDIRARLGIGDGR